jgi:hypothetical protein
VGHSGAQSVWKEQVAADTSGGQPVESDDGDAAGVMIPWIPRG